MAINDITGDAIKTKSVSDAYRKGYEEIFGSPIKKSCYEKTFPAEKYLVKVNGSSFGFTYKVNPNYKYPSNWVLTFDSIENISSEVHTAFFANPLQTFI